MSMGAGPMDCVCSPPIRSMPSVTALEKFLRRVDVTTIGLSPTADIQSTVLCDPGRFFKSRRVIGAIASRCFGRMVKTRFRTFGTRYCTLVTARSTPAWTFAQGVSGNLSAKRFTALLFASQLTFQPPSKFRPFYWPDTFAANVTHGALDRLRSTITFKAGVLFGCRSCLLNTVGTSCRKQREQVRRGGHPCPADEGEIHSPSAHLRMRTEVRNWGSVSQTNMACCHAIRSKISKLGIQQT